MKSVLVLLILILINYGTVFSQVITRLVSINIIDTETCVYKIEIINNTDDSLAIPVFDNYDEFYFYDDSICFSTSYYFQKNSRKEDIIYLNMCSSTSMRMKYLCSIYVPPKGKFYFIIKDDYQSKKKCSSCNYHFEYLYDYNLLKVKSNGNWQYIELYKNYYLSVSFKLKPN